MKELARLADERWASKPSFLDKPKTQPAPQTNNAAVNESSENAAQPVETQASAPETAQEPAPAVETPKENPWKNASRDNPGAEWQPEAWSPSSKR
jgi:NADH dehydrogenase [ubiquinone] 1 alpha subcomplex assembly factor 2